MSMDPWTAWTSNLAKAESECLASVAATINRLAPDLGSGGSTVHPSREAKLEALSSCFNGLGAAIEKPDLGWVSAPQLGPSS